MRLALVVRSLALALFASAPAFAAPPPLSADHPHTDEAILAFERACLTTLRVSPPPFDESLYLQHQFDPAEAKALGLDRYDAAWAIKGVRANTIMLFHGEKAAHRCVVQIIDVEPEAMSRAVSDLAQRMAAEFGGQAGSPPAMTSPEFQHVTFESWNVVGKHNFTLDLQRSADPKARPRATLAVTYRD